MQSPCTLGKEFATRSLLERYDALNALIEAAERGDREGVHEARIASRRLRAAIAEFTADMPRSRVKPARDRVRDITRLLGRPRELDVMIALLERNDLDLDAEHKRAHATALRSLRKRRADVAEACTLAANYTLDMAFVDAMQHLVEQMPEPPKCLLKRAARNLVEALKLLRAACKEWRKESGESALHEVRIHFKKFRYACELYAPLYGPGMDGYIARVKAVQDVLGDWNDWRVLRDELTQLAHTVGKVQSKRFNVLAELCGKRAESFLPSFDEAAAPLLNKPERKAFRAFLEKPSITCCQKESNAAQQTNPQ